MKGMREGVSVPAWRPKGWVCPPLEPIEAYLARIGKPVPMDAADEIIAICLGRMPS